MPLDFNAARILSNDIKHRLSAGTFTTLTAPEQAAIIDACTGIGEKGSDPLGCVLDLYTLPRINGFEQHRVEPGTIVGG